MNSRTMIAIDVSERVHVIDVRSEEELEVRNKSTRNCSLDYFSFSSSYFLFPLARTWTRGLLVKVTLFVQGCQSSAEILTPEIRLNPRR